MLSNRLFMSPVKQQFLKDGYLVLDRFKTPVECESLMQRGAELAAGFDYSGHPSVFQTSEQTRTSDDYFLNSGGNISFSLKRMPLMLKVI